jgi:hypothetical protein
MKTSFLGSRLNCPAIHSLRASATSGRSCSDACRVFFEAYFMTLEKAAERAVGSVQAEPLPDATDQIGQGQVALIGHQVQKPSRVGLQRRPAPAASRTLRHRPALRLQRYPANRRRGAHAEVGRRLAPRHPPRCNLIDDATTKIIRMSRTHEHLPNQRLHGFRARPTGEALQRSHSIHLSGRMR